jgi:ankyrin repeat protein
MHDAASDDAFALEALHRAAAVGDIDTLSRLLAEGHPLTHYDERHYTALHHAVLHGELAAARWLLEHGAAVDAHDTANIGETALSVAVRGEHVDVVALLLAHGADPDIPGWMGQSARTRAAKRGDPTGRRIAELLRGRGRGGRRP